MAVVNNKLTMFSIVGLQTDMYWEHVSWLFTGALACFPSEPLYQTYRATVIHKEIRRQTVCRNISKTSVDYAMDLSTLLSGNGNGTGIGSGPPRSSLAPTPSQSTLWQDLPSVRDSGMLEELTPEQCKYQEVRDLKRGEEGEAVVQRRDCMKKNQWAKEKWEMQCQVINPISK